jgi:hypothetical protein
MTIDERHRDVEHRREGQPRRPCVVIDGDGVVAHRRLPERPRLYFLIDLEILPLRRP